LRRPRRPGPRRRPHRLRRRHAPCCRLPRPPPRLPDSMDPYVILTCRSHEQKSTVASGAGSEPEWNETFFFAVSGEAPELRVKILSADDLVREA
uniref:C2 domain-containing protein n=1 Tax=Triticum urartu TaxID=4572 RepID=A0A8R7TXD2_TRIUA